MHGDLLAHTGFYEISLSLIEGIGPIRGKNLINHCGSAEAVFAESKNALLKIPDVGQKLVSALNRKEVFRRAEQELEFCEKHSIEVISFNHSKYPSRLRQCPDHPLVIFVKGHLDLNTPKVLSVVGTRRVTPQGKKVCEHLINDLKDQKILIVSGLAFGVDVCAHSAALDAGLPTAGVLAHGLDRIYPKEHKGVAQQMLSKGGLISEYLSGTNPDRENFPSRNRIVAGLADATLVIESQSSGGAMITANLAFGYHRDVLAVPGRPDDVFSAGCNDLIKSNRAGLVGSADDILKALNWEGKSIKKQVQTTLIMDLSDEENLILATLKESKKLSLDELSVKTNISVRQLAVPLLNLELNGVVEALPGKMYRSF